MFQVFILYSSLFYESFKTNARMNEIKDQLGIPDAIADVTENE